MTAQRHGADRGAPCRADPDADIARLADRTRPSAGDGRRPRRIAALPGGLTNRNYRVTRPTGRHGRRAVRRRRRAARDRPRRRVPQRLGRRGDRRRPGRSSPTPRARRARRRLDRRPDLTAADLDDSATLRWSRRPAAQLHARPAVRRRLRHVRVQRRYLDLVVSQRLPAAPAYLDFMPQVERDRRRRWPRAPSRPVPVPQRPARREHHGRRRPALVHRLRVRRQQRPVLRARQHLERGSICAPTG